jgi:hypothetical protein
MNLILIFLFSLPVFANRFTLKNTGARFDLVISPETIIFNSEANKRKFTVVKCNEKLAQALNAELLAKLPSKQAVKGLTLYLDEKPVVIDSQSDLAMTALAMDSRILRFAVEEKEACK